MKRKTIGIFALTLTTLLSCREPNGTSEGKPISNNNHKNEFMSISSTENGVAQIDIIFFTDQTFSYDMTILPQPFSGDSDESIHSAGIWANRGNLYRLTFANESIDISTLFDASDSSIVSIDRNQVTIDPSSGTLMIWGIVCKIHER